MVTRASIEEALATEPQFTDREPLTETILLRVPPSVKDALSQIATERGRSLSSEIRRLIFDYLRACLPGAE